MFFNHFLHPSARNEYLGCFVDNADEPDLPFLLKDQQPETPKICIIACFERNFRFAAMQNENQCRCGNEFGKYGEVSDDQCNRPCSTNEKCGGRQRNSVYSVLDSIDYNPSDSKRSISIFF